MKKEAGILTVISIGTVIGALLGAHRMVVAIHGSAFEEMGLDAATIYTFILIIFTIWYSKIKIDNIVERFEAKLVDLHETVTKERQNSIKIEVEKTTLIVKNIEGKIEYMSNLLETLNKHSLNEKV